MAQIQKGDTFADGQLVTAARLNALLDSAILNPNAITDQALITTGDLSDTLLVYQASTSALKKITFGDLIGISISGGLGVLTVTQVFGNTGLSISTGAGNVTIAGYNNTDIGNASSASGNTNIYSYNDINIDCSIGNVVIACTTNFTTTGAIKIPVGTTAQRPATAVAGQLRYNSTTTLPELYNGTAWASIGGSYSLYEVLEFTPTAFTASASGTYQTAWTSSSFTKPANEIWTIELDTTCSTNGTADITLVRAKYGSGAVQGYDEVWANHFGGSGKHIKHITFKTVVNAGTALTSETYVVEINAANTPAQCTVNDATYPAKFRIFKYKL